jgi:hypothetical protein
MSYATHVHSAQPAWPIFLPNALNTFMLLAVSMAKEHFAVVAAIASVSAAVSASVSDSPPIDNVRRLAIG